MDNAQEHQSQQHAEAAAQAAQDQAEQQAQHEEVEQLTPEAALRLARRSVDEQLSTLLSSQADSATAEQRLVELQADVGRATQQRDQNVQHTIEQVVALHRACNESIGAVEALKAAHPLPAAGPAS